MSVTAPEFAPAAAHCNTNGERQFAIRDPTSSGRDVFACWTKDGHMHRGRAFPVIKVTDPADAEAVEWRDGLSAAVVFDNPNASHKVIQFCQQDDLLDDEASTAILQQLDKQCNADLSINIGSVVLAHVTAGTYMIATIKYKREPPRGKAIKTAGLKPYTVEYLSPKQRETQKVAKKGDKHVKKMTLASSCLQQGDKLNDVFPSLGEEEVALREAKAQKAEEIRAKSSCGSLIAVETPDTTIAVGNMVSPAELTAQVSAGKKRASSPSSRNDGTNGLLKAPAVKCIKSADRGDLNSSSEDKMSIQNLLNPLTSDPSANDSPSIALTSSTDTSDLPASAEATASASSSYLPPRDTINYFYFDSEYGCQFIEKPKRKFVYGEIEFFKSCSSSVEQFQEFWPSKADALSGINKYKQHYQRLVIDGNTKKAEMAVETNRDTQRTPLGLIQRQINFRWDSKWFDEITENYRMYFNKVIAIYCELYGDDYGLEKVA